MRAYSSSSGTIQPHARLTNILNRMSTVLKTTEKLEMITSKRRSSAVMKIMKKVLPKRRTRRKMMITVNERTIDARPDIQHALCLLAVLDYLILAVYNLITLYLITIIN